MIDHRKRYEVNVRTSAEPHRVQRTKRDTFSVNQDEGFFGQQPAQIELDGTVPAIANVQICGCARLLWQKSCQIRCIANAQFFDVCRAVRIHWIRTSLFRCWNVRASDDDTFHFDRRSRCHLCRHDRLSGNLGDDGQANSDKGRSSNWW